MERIVMQRGGLTEAQAVVAVQIAKSQNALFGGTDDYLVTRELAASTTRDEKLALLDCCFAVSAADRDITGERGGGAAQDRQRARALPRRPDRGAGRLPRLAGGAEASWRT